MNTQDTLSSYCIDYKHGFLPATAPLTKLPDAYKAWDDLAAEISFLLNCKAFKKRVAALPILNIDHLTTHSELERAMLLLSCFGHAYVWENYESSGFIPKQIAVPWTEVANRLGRKTALAHASLVLQNWALIDPKGNIELDNLRTLIQFHGGIDESWFYLVTTEIEAKGASLIRSIVKMRSDVAADNSVGVKQELENFLAVQKQIWLVLNRTYENCDPYVFFTRVRPFLASLKDIRFEGCDPEIRNLFGGSAAQSSLLQVIDGVLGVVHPEPRARQYLDEMRNYMPKDHVRFIRDIESENFLEPYVKQYTELTGIYMECVEALTEFRQLHLELVAKFIMAQTPTKGGPGHTGTGGTNPMIFLKQVKNDTQVKTVTKVEA